MLTGMQTNGFHKQMSAVLLLGARSTLAAKLLEAHQPRCEPAIKNSHKLSLWPTSPMQFTCHDAAQVVPHVTEVQVVLSNSKVSLKGRYLLS